MQKAASQANGVFVDSSKPAKGPPSTIIVEQEQHSMGLLEHSNVAANNMAQGMAAIAQHDYQVETVNDEKTGATITKVTTTKKQTGEIVSKQVLTKDKDGKTHIQASGTSSAGSPFGFGSGQMSGSTEQSLPPELPTTGEIDYTMESMVDGEYKVICKVKDGPEAGKVIEYKVRNNGQAEKGPTYEVVRIRNPKSRQRWILGGFFTILVVCAAIVLVEVKGVLLDGLCMPVVPHWSLPIEYAQVETYEAPWWSPGSGTKARAFSLICDGRQRTSLSWIREEKQNVFVVKVLQDQETKEGEMKTTEKTLLTKKGLRSAVATATDISVTTTSGKTTTLSAPWRLNQ